MTETMRRLQLGYSIRRARFHRRFIFPRYIAVAKATMEQKLWHSIFLCAMFVTYTHKDILNK